MYSLLRPLLFKLNAELAHTLSLNVLKYIPTLCFSSPLMKPINAMGLTFPHPVGLAAGLDKNGEYLDALAKLGFAFIELGTVTPKAQIGNAKPRLFRLPAARAIINRMGFNNQGVDALVEHVRRADYQGILGINIGKNKDTSLNQAVEDYRYCLQKVYAQASYITINISSPNTPDLRQLQQGDYFIDLLSKLTEEQQYLAEQYQRFVPLVVKISPDESDEALKQMAEVIVKQKIAGIIATNTTYDRNGVNGIKYSEQTGGLSGSPLFNRSNHCLNLLRRLVGSEVTLIGVGGIDSPQAAKEKMQNGAQLVQIYSGLIYQGPALIPKIVAHLQR